MTGSVVVDKDGHVLAAGKLDVDADLNVSINDSSELRSTGNMTVDATEGYVWVNDNSVLGTSGTLEIGKDANIGTDFVVTEDSLVTASGDTTINVAGDVIVDNGNDSTGVYGYTAGSGVSVIRVGSIDWNPATPGTVTVTVDSTHPAADLTVVAGGDVSVQNAAAVGASGTAGVTASGSNGITVKNTAYLASKDAMTPPQTRLVRARFSSTTRAMCSLTTPSRRLRRRTSRSSRVRKSSPASS